MGFLEQTSRMGFGQMGAVPEQPLILGRYRVMGQAGAGGFGTVQAAWDTRIHRRVAVKCMDVPVAMQNGYYDSRVFDALAPGQIPGLEEARTAAMLTHPNIVQVYDFEVENGTAYLIMEYVDGMTLTQFMKTVGDNMTIDMVTAIFEGIAHALAYAHENQVLHLDIKPDNVMIDRQGQVKVTDFGMARLSDVWGYSAASGGTIGYMPPEQMRQMNLDERCDEWALASVLYEMIAGRNPFYADDIPHAIQVIENAEIVLPSLCMKGVSTAADDVIFYALDPDRHERYATVADFEDEIGHYLGNSTIGSKQVQSVVGATLVDDGSEPAPNASHRRQTIGRLRQTMNGRFTAISLRIWALATAAVAGYAALPTIDVLGGWQSPPCLIIYAVMLVLAFSFPTIGAALSLAALAAAMLVNGSHIVGLILAGLSVAWWSSSGRRGPAQSNVGTVPFLAGTVGLNQIAPLLGGFFLPPRDAAISAVFAWLLAVLLAACGSMSFMGWTLSLGYLSDGVLEENALCLLSDPSPWILLASWVLAASISSLCFRHDTRSMAVLGAVVGGALLIAGAVVSAGVTSEFLSWNPDVNQVVPGVLAALLIGVLGWVYSPERSDVPEYRQ